MGDGKTEAEKDAESIQRAIEKTKEALDRKREEGMVE